MSAVRQATRVCERDSVTSTATVNGKREVRRRSATSVVPSGFVGEGTTLSGLFGLSVTRSYAEGWLLHSWIFIEKIRAHFHARNLEG
jgi:hypothetical protein